MTTICLLFSPTLNSLSQLIAILESWRNVNVVHKIDFMHIKEDDVDGLAEPIAMLVSICAQHLQFISLNLRRVRNRRCLQILNSLSAATNLVNMFIFFPKMNNRLFDAYCDVLFNNHRQLQLQVSLDVRHVQKSWLQGGIDRLQNYGYHFVYEKTDEKIGKHFLPPPSMLLFLFHQCRSFSFYWQYYF